MTLDMLLFLIRISRSILVSESELWPASTLSVALQRDLRRGLRRHRRGVRLLLAWSSIDACPNPGLHRQYFYHAGNQEYRCAMCERLAAWIA